MSQRKRARFLQEAAGIQYTHALAIVRGEAGLTENSADCAGVLALRELNLCRPPFAKSYACLCDTCLDAQSD